MKSFTRIMTGMLAVTTFILLQNPSFAQEKAKESKAGHSHEKSEVHGGEVLMSKQHHFEVVWMADHVMVYIYDHHEQFEGSPAPRSKAVEKTSHTNVPHVRQTRLSGLHV